MPSIEITCNVDLTEPITLSISDVPHFPSISVPLKGRRFAAVSLDVPTEEIAKHLKRLASNRSWIMCAPVRRLLIHFTEHVSDDELARLHGRHPTAREFMWNGQPRQETPGLGDRVAADIRSAARKVLQHIRDSLGQWWILPTDDGQDSSAYLRQTEARWREPGGSWQRLAPVPHVISFELSIGAAAQYLDMDDWAYLDRLIAGKDNPSLSLTLFADACSRFHAGDAATAIIHLNTAIEWAVRRFVDAKLAGVIPKEGVKSVLRSSYDRLLDDWVRPLAEREGINLDQDWPRITAIRGRRHAVLHRGERPLKLSEPEFNQMLGAARSMVGRLLNVREPKAPLYPVSEYEAYGKQLDAD